MDEHGELHLGRAETSAGNSAGAGTPELSVIDELL